MEYFIDLYYKSEIPGLVPVQVSADGKLHDRVRGGGNQARQDVRHHHPGLHHLLGAALPGDSHQHQSRLERCQELSVTRGEVFFFLIKIKNSTKENSSIHFDIIGVLQRKYSQ